MKFALIFLLLFGLSNTAFALEEDDDLEGEEFTIEDMKNAPPPAPLPKNASVFTCRYSNYTAEIVQQPLLAEFDKSMKKCWPLAKKSPKTAKLTKLLLSFSLKREGRVLAAEIAPDEINGTPFATCLLDEMANTWQFPTVCAENNVAFRRIDMSAFLPTFKEVVYIDGITYKVPQTEASEVILEGLAEELSNYPKFIVYTKRDLAAKLELADLASIVGVDSTEIGGALGAKYVLSGEIVELEPGKPKLGVLLNVTMKNIDNGKEYQGGWPAYDAGMSLLKNLDICIKDLIKNYENQPQIKIPEPVDLTAQKKISQTENWSKIKVNDVVEFGQYENYPKYVDPIKWRVLERQGNKFLLISDQILFLKPFANKTGAWLYSPLRKWLNDEFMADSFTCEQRSKILLSELRTEGNEQFKTQKTKDYIFLASEEEIKKYRLYSAKYRYETIKWWLRTPGRETGTVAFVYYNFSSFGLPPTEEGVGVRPMMWVQIDD